jgi:hypothetical protein
VLHWVGVSERRGEEWLTIDEREEGSWLVSRAVKGEQTPHQAMDKIEQSVQPTGQTGVQDDLELTNQDLATVQRALQFQDSMSDERLEESLKKEARLIKRRAELKQVQAKGEALARQREQAKDLKNPVTKVDRCSRIGE